MKLAVVGATGLVGQEILKVLEQRDFQFSELYLVASAKSVGQKMSFRGKEYTVQITVSNYTDGTLRMQIDSGALLNVNISGNGNYSGNFTLK